MAAWIALIISTTSLLVSIITQHDKIASAMKDFRIWRNDREQRIKAEEIIEKLSSSGAEVKKETTEKKPGLGSNIIAFFLPLSICSGASSILDIDTIIGLSIIGAIPFVTIMITIARQDSAEELKSKTTKWFYWLIVIIGVLGSAFVGIVWAGMTTVAMMGYGLSVLWAGIASAAIFTFLAWISQFGRKGSNAA